MRYYTLFYVYYFLRNRPKRVLCEIQNFAILYQKFVKRCTFFCSPSRCFCFTFITYFFTLCFLNGVESESITSCLMHAQWYIRVLKVQIYIMKKHYFIGFFYSVCLIQGWQLLQYSKLYNTDYGHPEKKQPIARPKIQSQSQIFRYGRSIFCLPHRPKFPDFFDLCLHWVSIVRDTGGPRITWFQSILTLV